MNILPGKENSLVIELFVCYLLVLLYNSGRNNILVALEENNLIVYLIVCPAPKGKRGMLDAGERLFFPLGILGGIP